MHERIVKEIQRVIETSPWGDRVDIFIKSQPTGGFWGMAIRDKVGDGKLYLPHIKNLGKAIGSMYGESLCIELEGNCLVMD